MKDPYSQSYHMRMMNQLNVWFENLLLGLIDLIHFKCIIIVLQIFDIGMMPVMSIRMEKAVYCHYGGLLIANLKEWQ